MNTSRLGTAQIGLGYWGPNLLRNLRSEPRVRVIGVADLSADALAEVSGDLKKTSDHTELLADSEVQAVVIATPAGTHAQLVGEALEAGKHVLVEKPLAMSVKEGRRLVEMAGERELTLMVGHTFLYNAAVQKLKSYIDHGELGDVYYLTAERLNLGRVRQDVNALWNFAPHDISIIVHLLGERPVEVSARGHAYLQPGIEDVVFANLVFGDGRAAHVHISWLDPHKVRRMTVVGSKKMAVYDDVDAEARITLHDRGIDRVPTADSPRDFESFAEFQLHPRRGDVLVPAFPFPEPLKVECAHFAECVLDGIECRTDGRHAVEVIEVLEAIQRSIDESGRPIRLADL